MSTKTTFKRIALVTVAALGFGMLATVPAKAYSATATLGYSSLTVVGCTAANTASGRFYVDITDDAGIASPLVGNESITVAVVAKPTSVTATATILTDLTFQSITVGAKGDSAVAVGGAATQTLQVPNGAGTVSTHASNNQTYTATQTTGASSRYYFAVYPNTTNACDQGAYTVRVRVTDSTGFITDRNIAVKFVTSAADSGAVFTIASTGDLRTSQPLPHTTANKVSVTLRDAAGGRVQTAHSTTGNVASTVPDIAVSLVTALDAVEGLTDADTGVAGTDHVASTTAAAATLQLQNQAGDGVYGVTSSSISSAVSTTTVLRARYGSTSTTAAINIYGATTAVDSKTDLTLTATGVLAADQLIKNNVDSTTAYTLPTTTTSAKLRINIDTAGDADLPNQAMTVKTVWSGNYATASVSPATTTTTTTLTDASGNIDLAITNSAPLAGAVATITITGYTYTAGTSRGTDAGSTVVTLTWAAAKATTITVIDPVASVKVKTGSTNVLTVSVKDQFGNLMSGESLQPSVAGSNVSTTTTYAAVTTGAAGTATFSLTDAAAVTATTDTVSFASVSNSAATPGTFTLSYVATLPVVATMTGYYNNDWNTAASSLIPSTGIYGATGTATKVSIANGRNLSTSLTAFADGDDDDMVRVRVRAVTSTGAAAAGAAVTITAPTGGHVLNSSGLPASTRTVAVDASGDAVFQILATAPGALTWTIASGTVSTSVSLWVATPAAAAGRTVAITGATTATANGDGVPMTVTVKDRYGNAVTGVNLTLSATGAAAFAGGATTQSFQTDATGTYTFDAKSFVAAGGAGTYKVSAGNATDSASPAGYSGGVEVDSTLAAGISSATATVTFAAGEDAAAANAQAASDAAAEATDAANAATDAANAAAEAADAATAAAQDAADAVAALSTQVSEMVNALKKQITALTNLVIKIQKKVKA
jgi:hypothetical protein